jgi:hypothetical protein
VGRVAEHKDALAGQIGAVHGCRPPGQPQPAFIDQRIAARQRQKLADEGARGADADRHGLGPGLAKCLFQPARGTFPRLGVHQHVGMRRGHPGDVGGCRPERRHHVHRDPQAFDQPPHLFHIVSVAESQRSRPDQVHTEGGRPVDGFGQRANDLQERLVGAEVLFPAVAGQFQRDHRDWQAHGLGQTAGIVLDQFGGAGRAHDHRLGVEAVERILAGRAEQVRRVRPQVARLEGGVGHRRAAVAPLDHGEQQVGVGVALRRVQDIVQPAHGGRHTHRPHMGRAFVGPDRQLHAAAPAFRIARRRRGRANRPARSPACS